MFVPQEQVTRKEISLYIAPDICHVNRTAFIAPFVLARLFLTTLKVGEKKTMDPEVQCQFLKAKILHDFEGQS